MRLNRNRVRGLAAAAVGLALVAGCGSSPTASSGGGGGSSSGSGTSVYDQIAKAAPDQQRATALRLAKKEGTLDLYTSFTADVLDPVQKAFTAQTGIKVKAFRGNSETVLQRVSQEASARHLGADAVETNFLEMQTMSDQGLFADYKGSHLAQVIPTGKFDHWTASRFNIFLPAWNTNLIKPADEPRSWEDLALPKYKGKFSLELSDSDWFENVTKYWLAHGKSQAQVDDLWKKIAANGKKTKGHTDSMALLSAGQTPMNAMNYTYITQKAKDKGAPVAYRHADGTSEIPAFPRPNGVGMFKDAKHPAAAWLFYDWLLSDGQKVLVEQKLSPSTKVSGDNSLQGLNLVTYDVATLTKDAKTWDTKYDAVLRGASK
jgi:iron(III) transport system substrate-binding protein